MSRFCVAFSPALFENDEKWEMREEETKMTMGGEIFFEFLEVTWKLRAYQDEWNEGVTLFFALIPGYA